MLEMTLYGGSCRFEEDTVIALTGADMQPTVNQKPIAMNQAVKVPAGGVLNLGMAKTGCRTYLAVHCRWETNFPLEKHYIAGMK